MIFATLPTAKAEGAILAHTTRLPGRVLHKGTVLDTDDIQALQEAGIASVICATLEPGDIGEDEAATRLADALLAPGLIRVRPGTGRANLAAAHAGLFRADATRIDALNAVDPSLTIATLADATPVAAGDIVATVKIIPFAAPGAALTRAEALAQAAPALRLPPFLPLRVGLVLTALPGTKQSVLQSTAEVTAERVRALTGRLLPPRQVPHDEADIAAALASLRAEGAELLLIAGASAVVDRADIAPAAILRAGGRVTRFGMPVDPGNLICLGAIGTTPAIILPGCARSPRLNGIDYVLRRLFAGETVSDTDVTRMGVGGLLHEYAARPMPRIGATPPSAGSVAAIILAAGLSSRMAPRNKLLLADVAGTPMVARVADEVLASVGRPVVLVTGHQADAVTQAVAGRDLTVVHAANYAAGLSASLKVGIQALPPGASAVVICLGDMPLVPGALIDTLIAAHDPQGGRLVIVPTCRGRRGNPVLWDRRFFAEMASLTGDTGARSLMMRYADLVFELETGDEGVLMDFDTPKEGRLLF